MLSKTRNAMRLRDRLITVLFLVPVDCIRSRWGTIVPFPVREGA